MDRGGRRVGLLRGVNVGGHHKMLMANLRSMMNDIGFVDIETYIQSGNVVFGSGPEGSDDAAHLISTAIEDAFGFHVPVLVRTHGDLVQALSISCQLFPPDQHGEHPPDDKNVHVVFLSTTPALCVRSRLDSGRFPHDEFVLADDVLHVRYGEGAGQSKLTLSVIEKAFGVAATARNLATVNKLAEMADR